MTAVDVAIVGAGFAGLSAAHALKAGGAKIALLEAQDQAGGRVKTIVLADGLAIDRGGQFYCRVMSNIAALVEDYGLTRRDVRKDKGVVALLQGQREILENDFLTFHFFDAILAAEPNTPGSLAEWVRSLGLDARAVAMIKSGCEEVIGRPIEELSFRSVREVLTKFAQVENSMEYCCVEGLGTLAGLMAKDLGTAFKANAPVSSIDRKDGLFHLIWPSGAITAKKVVYAASPVVLGRIDWKAPQDRWLARHADLFVAGKMRKFVLRYESAFWRGSDFGWLGQTDNPAGLSVMDCSTTSDSLCLLAVFCGGTAAMALENLAEEAAVTKVMDFIEPMLGPQVRRPLLVVQTNWTDHPWVGGAYATWPRPWTDEDPWAPMRRSHDGLFFTGAELADFYPGFIEGAVRSGREVAARVLQEG